MSAKAPRPHGTARRPGRPPGPSQAEHLRQRLVAEASELYAEAGYAGISFATLAERTGLTKATVFHYFPKKETLVYAVFEALGARLEAATLGLFDAPPASFAARLERVVNSLVDFYGAHPLNARCSSSFKTRTTFPGVPSTIDPGGTCIRGGTTAPAPTMLRAPIRAPSSTVAPIPIRHSSSIVHAWTIAPCPIVHHAPITASRSSARCTTQLS